MKYYVINRIKKVSNRCHLCFIHTNSKYDDKLADKNSLLNDAGSRLSCVNQQPKVIEQNSCYIGHNKNTGFSDVIC